MKVRVLYPTGCIVAGDFEAGAVVDIDAALANALIAEGAAEPIAEKRSVEQATAAPGEKRNVRKRPSPS